MRFRQTQEKRKVKANVDLTPLIDVVFQLLIFFMLSATFVVQTSINIEMPEAKGATSLEQKDLTVTLAYGEGGPEGGGAIYVDNEEVDSMVELSQRLAGAIAEYPDIRVLIRPDARIPTGRLVQVFGYIHSVGIERYFIAAQPPSDEE